MLYFIIMINPTYKRRSHRTFITLIVLRLIPASLFLVVVLALASVAKQFAGYVLGIGFLFFIILSAFLVLSAWLEYISFRFYLDDNAFKIQTGIFNINEISILYHQIQNVDIERPLLYRMMNMSRVVVLTAAHEDEKVHTNESDETEGIIDLIDADEAESLQHELLSRSNVQEVKEVKSE